MLNHFTYNGRSTGEFGLLVSGANIYGSPSRVVEKVQIPYRNGDLLIDTGVYNNYILTYEVSIIDNTKATAQAISEWLLSSKGYNRLEDTYVPDQFRMASYYNQLDYTLTSLNRFGRATISFDCKPQKYLKTGETTTTLTTSGTITNPTQNASKPLIRVYGTGTLTVNDLEITINSVDEYVDIDSERMQVFKGSVNKGSTVSMTDFPELVGGENTLTLSGLTRVIITPRWWRL